MDGVVSFADRRRWEERWVGDWPGEVVRRRCYADVVLVRLASGRRGRLASANGARVDGVDSGLGFAEGRAEGLSVAPRVGQGLAVAAEDVGEVVVMVMAETVGLKLAQEEAVDLIEKLIETVGGCAEVAEDGVRGEGLSEAGWARRGVVELADVFVQVGCELDGLVVVNSGGGGRRVVGHVGVSS